MTGSSLECQVVAAIGGGDAHHRAVALACAEAGAALALATFNPSSQQEYAVNSIANEVWAIGPEHFVDVIETSDVSQLGGFAQKSWRQLSRCDALVVVSSLPRPEVTAPEEERRAYAGRHRAPLLAAQAFGQLMRDQGSGVVVFVAPERDPADAKALSSALAAHLGAGGPRVVVVGEDAPAPEEAAVAVLAILAPAHP